MPKRNHETWLKIHGIKKLADGAKSSKEISRILNISQKYVQRILLEFDLPRLNQGGPTGIRNGSTLYNRRITHDGYVYISAPQGHPFAIIPKGKNIGYIYEHRIVAEEKINRYLLPTEVVDHVDNIHLHNHPDNLRIFQSNSDHLKNTISGNRPAWSEEGFQKMKIAPHLRKDLPRVDNYYKRRKRGDVRLQQILLAWLSLSEDSPYLLGTRQWLEKAGITDLSHSNLERCLQRLSQP